MVGFRGFMSANEVAIHLAIDNASDLMNVGESIRTLVVSLSLNGWFDPATKQGGEHVS